MKKLKLLLTLAVVAILATGVLVGCSAKFEIDPAVTPHKVTYCANGGHMGEASEVYYYYQDNAPIIAPMSSGTVKNAVHKEFTLLGWVKAELNPDGTPKLRETPVSENDGGILVCEEDGPFADTEDVISLEDRLGHKYKRWYYSYDMSDGFYDFAGGRVGENLVLVAVWGVYNQFFVVPKDAEGNWVDFSDLYALDENNAVTDKVTKEEEILARYSGNLTAITNAQNEIKNKGNVDPSYKNVRDGNTVLNYYLDEECTVELTFPHQAQRPLTPIYYKEIEGVYDLVTDFSGFRDAVRANRNIYLMNDIDFAGKNVDFNTREYRGTIKGNGNKLNNISVTIQQTVCMEGEENVYGGLFGVLNGATIKDVEINIAITFEIGVDPAGEGNYGQYTPINDQGTERDAVCYVGMLAGSIEGECVISGVVINATCAETRSTIMGKVNYDENKQPIPEMFENEYEVEVEFGGWQGKDVEDDERITDSAINIVESEDSEADAE